MSQGPKKTGLTIALLWIGLVVLAACKSAPPPPPPPKPPEPQVVKLTIAVSPDANPDIKNRPSPIVVRVYQLKDDAGFKDADFFALYEKEASVLGAGLISRAEFEVGPGQKQVIDYQISLDARFIGVAAAYRDIRNAGWRAQLGSQDKGLAGFAKNNKVSVLAGRANVTLSAE
jgi:type VI secretion system protein VasD